MKSLFVSAFLLLGTVCASRAQVSTTKPLPDTDNPAPDFSATSADKAALPDFLGDALPEPHANASFSAPRLSTALVAEPAPAKPAPRPEPEPRPKAKRAETAKPEQPKTEQPKPGGPKGQLYNLAKDLEQKNNVWLQHPEIVGRLHDLLEQYKKDGHSRPTK